MPKKKTEADCFEVIMRNFDFEKVRRAMVAVRWTWHGSPLSPTVQQLKDSVRDKFELLQDDPGLQGVYSGGLRLSRGTHDGRKYLTLEFLLAEYESEITA